MRKSCFAFSSRVSGEVVDGWKAVLHIPLDVVKRCGLEACAVGMFCPRHFKIGLCSSPMGADLTRAHSADFGGEACYGLMVVVVEST
jgi:hypothetical protein